MSAVNKDRLSEFQTELKALVLKYDVELRACTDYYGEPVGKPKFVSTRIYQKERRFTHELEAALKHLVEVIDAHEIESLSCDRDGNKYCDCLRNAATEAKSLLLNSKSAKQ